TARPAPPPLALSPGEVHPPGHRWQRPPCRHHRWPGRAAVPRPLPVLPPPAAAPPSKPPPASPSTPAFAAGRERLCSPAVTSSSRPPEKPARESEGQKVTRN